MGFLNKNFSTFLGAVLASSLLFVFSCSKDEEGGNGGNGTPTVVKHTLSITKPKSGTLVSKPEGINCGSKDEVCKAQFDEGTEITLTATPAPGYGSGAWSDDCRGAPDLTKCVLIMNADKTVGKKFDSRPNVDLGITEPTHGMITSEPSSIRCGSRGATCKATLANGAEIKLIAEADKYYMIGAWGGACVEAGLSNTCTLEMNDNKRVTKAFNLPGKKTLTITTKPANGTITSSPSGINCGEGNDDCNSLFDHDQKVTLTAAPKTNYELGGWGGDCSSSDATYELIMNTDKTVNKVFSIIQHTLTITAPMNGTITSNPDGIDCKRGSSSTTCEADFNHGTDVILTAAPDANHELGDWSGGGCSGSGTACTVAMTTDKTGITKAFTAIQRTLTITRPMNGTITSNPGSINCGSGAGETACSATFGHGTRVTLTATPKTNYVAGAWSGCSGSGTTCTVAMTTDTAVVKAFTIAQRTLTIATKPANGTITSNPSGINCGQSNATCEADFDHGTSVTLTAAPKADYELGAWGGGCLSAGSAATCILDMTVNKTGITKAFNATGGALDADGDGVADADDIDDDNDGLIEVHNLDMFDHIRHNLAGTSYKTGSSVAHNRNGAPKAETANCTTATAGVYLCGYELTKDLDFAIAGSYAGDSVNDNWRPLDSSGNVAVAKDAVNAGFDGITDFAGIFDGNGHSISNLYSKGGSRDTDVGLFKSIVGAVIRSLGLVDANLYTSTSGSGGGDGRYDTISTLVGINYGGLIIASYAKGGSVNNFRDFTNTAGLVGTSKNGGSIIACYATVEVNGSDEIDLYLGGLVGWNDGSSIIAASYATGTVNGGAGDDSSLGGLVGYGGNITASYATGNINSGLNGEDDIGALVGSFPGSRPIVASYGFGNVLNGTANMNSLAGAPGSKTVNGLTVDNADDNVMKNIWDDAASKTKGAWDFGTTSQPPALKYADYDGVGSGVDYCALFPACGNLLPGQRP